MNLSKDLAYSLDPVRFAIDCLNFNPDKWQTEVLRSKAKRMLLNCSRQSGKSITTAVMALHRALFYPDSLILMLSPSLRQSGELFRKVTDFIKQLASRPELTEDNKLSLQLGNGSRIVSLPSTDGTIRGFSGVSLIIEDEAARVPDSLYMAIRPMLAVSGGRLILMSTPFGKRGHFFQAWTQEGKHWQQIEIKATDCTRIKPEFLEEEQASLGDWWYRQEYLCEFVETLDQVFNYKNIMQAITPDVLPLFEGGL